MPISFSLLVIDFRSDVYISVFTKIEDVLYLAPSVNNAPPGIKLTVSGISGFLWQHQSLLIKICMYNNKS